MSDPHGDLAALESVILDLERTDVDEVLVGGDLAQGGPQPAEIVDRIRQMGWPSVRGNADDFLVHIAEGSNHPEPAQSAHQEAPSAEAISVGEWSVEQLGPERIQYLRSLPISIERGPFAFGRLVLVHATPWSTEDVVLPDAEPELAQCVVDEAGAGLLAYGHIHTAYQRRVGDAVLLSVGGVNGSNDTDPSPAYTIVDLGATITVEVRRVENPLQKRIDAYRRAGRQLETRDVARLSAPGPFPVRSRAGIRVVVWP